MNNNMRTLRLGRRLERELQRVAAEAELRPLACRSCAAPWPDGQVKCACGSLYAVESKAQ